MQRSLVLWFSVAALAAVAPFAGCSSSSDAPSTSSVDAGSASATDGASGNNVISTAADTGSPDSAIVDAGAGDAGADADAGDPVYTGIETCASMLANGWDPKAGKSDFSSEAAYNAFVDLNTCACVNSWADNGCSNVCDNGVSGFQDPDFCNGVTMLVNCRWCLQGVGNGQGPSNSCGAVYDACNAN